MVHAGVASSASPQNITGLSSAECLPPPRDLTHLSACPDPSFPAAAASAAAVAELQSGQYVRLSHCVEPFLATEGYGSGELYLGRWLILRRPWPRSPGSRPTGPDPDVFNAQHS